MSTTSTNDSNVRGVARPNTPKSQTQEMQHYLVSFMPILTEGLTEMSLVRPKDPHAFLSAYLLAQSQYPDAASLCDSIREHAGSTVSRPASRPASAGKSSHHAGTTVAAGASSSAGGQPLRIIIAGAPCSGKGTQCDAIESTYGVYHLSTGDLLRAEVAAGSELGKKAKEFMDHGKLIPDDLIIDVVSAKVNEPEIKQRGWLLDGFPRTAVQAEALESIGLHPDIFLQLNVPDQVLIQRVTGRRTDPETGKTYHVQFDPPPADVAARCIQRSDDTEEKIQTRLKAYHDAISAIEKIYKDVRVEIDGNRKKDGVQKEVLQAIQQAKGKGKE